MASGPWPGDGLSQDQLPMEQQGQQQSQPQQEEHQSINTPSIPSGNDNAALDRQMLRHLMARYSEQELARWILEERGSPHTQNDAASVMTSSTFSSVKSEDAPSMFDSASIRTFSTDNSSSTRGSIISNVSARTAKFLGRRTHTNRAATSIPSIENGDSTNWDDDGTATDGASISSASKQKGSFMCAFCKEENIQKTCTRKNDLKRHMEDFHNMNAQWSCKVRGCGMVFDWQTAYKTHLKQVHQGSRSTVDEAKVDLCPQTVFACGFENCSQVFEAPSDADAATTFKDYVAHVVKHFDEGASSGEWTYSTRMRNLLRQSGVFRAWTNTFSEAERANLEWRPQSSVVLRRRLETRHIGDLQLLMRYAVALGTDSATMPKPHNDFKMPVRHECMMPIQGHKNRLHGAPGAPEPEFQFKISRAADPNLQAYLASQRKIMVPRAPPRSGRSARPPTMTMHRQAAAHMNAPQYNYNHGNPPASMFHPQQMHHHQHQHQQPQPFAMMAPPEEAGGIIADDLRNLRSMADTIPNTDIEMGDSNMIDSTYMDPQHDYSGGFSQALHSSPGDSSVPAQHQHHAFGAYDGSQAY